MGRFEVDLQTLELDQNASGEEIKQAYKDLVMVWHPDRFSHNPRLQQKAEAKLKRFNQAYEHLKGWRHPPSASKRSVHPPASPFVGYQAAPSSRRPSPRSPQASRHSPRPPHRPAARTTSIGSLWISLAEAKFILQHYRFESLNQVDRPQHSYQGGPFVLVTSEAPPEVVISVPCNSVQRFDRILLSIPCKSMGHFIEQDAEQLLQLLHKPETPPRQTES